MVDAGEEQEPTTEEAFQGGCIFACVVLRSLGVQWQTSRLVEFLDGLVSGETTLLPTPSEVKDWGRIKLLKTLTDPQERRETDDSNRAMALLMREILESRWKGESDP